MSGPDTVVLGKRSSCDKPEGKIQTCPRLFSDNQITDVFTTDDDKTFFSSKTAVYMGVSSNWFSLLAGHPTNSGNINGNGPFARFGEISSIALCKAPTGLIVCDKGNNSIRFVSRNMHVTTCAGMGRASSAVDGEHMHVGFNEPTDITRDKNGLFYISDKKNSCIRIMKVRQDGTARVTTLVYNEASIPRLLNPTALTFDRNDDLIIADTGNHCIRKVTVFSDIAKKTMTVIAGTPSKSGDQEGDKDTARFNAPTGVLIDRDNNILVADTMNHCIRMISCQSFAVSTIAGKPSRSGTLDGRVSDQGLLEMPAKLRTVEKAVIVVFPRDFTKKSRMIVNVLNAPCSLSFLTRNHYKRRIFHALSDFSSLLKDVNNNLADIEFRIHSTCFLGHSQVFASRGGEFFKNLIRCEQERTTSEKRSERLIISLNSFPVNFFLVLQDYMYNWRLPSSSKVFNFGVGELLQYADYVQISYLFEHLCELFQSELSIDNVVDHLLVVSQKNMPKPKQLALNFIKNNAYAFQEKSMEKLHEVECRNLLMEVTTAITTGLVSNNFWQ